MYSENSENIEEIQSLLHALRDAVDEKRVLNKRIVALNKDLDVQLRGLNREINRELKILAEFDKVNPFSEKENINCVRETTRHTPFTFLYFDNRRVERHNYDALTTKKLTRAFSFLWRGSEATDLIVVQRDGRYYRHIYHTEMCNLNGRLIIGDVTMCYNNFIRLLQLNDYFSYLAPDMYPF